MRTSVDVKLKEYDLKLIEKEYDRISIFVEDTKKLDRICNSVNKLTNGTILKAIRSKEFEKKYFKQAFAQMRKLHGAGHVFMFNGNLYTTDYKEEK